MCVCVSVCMYVSVYESMSVCLCVSSECVCMCVMCMYMCLCGMYTCVSILYVVYVFMVYMHV